MSTTEKLINRKSNEYISRDLEEDFLYEYNDESKINCIRAFFVFIKFLLVFSGWMLICLVKANATRNMLEPLPGYNSNTSSLLPPEFLTQSTAELAAQFSTQSPIELAAQSLNQSAAELNQSTVTELSPADEPTYSTDPRCDNSRDKYWIISRLGCLRNSDFLTRACEYTYVDPGKLKDSYNTWWATLGLIVCIAFVPMAITPGIITCCCAGREDGIIIFDDANSNARRKNKKTVKRDGAWLSCSGSSQQSSILFTFLMLVTVCVVFFAGYLKSSNFERCSPVDVSPTTKLVEFANSVENCYYNLLDDDSYKTAKEIYDSGRCKNFKVLEKGDWMCPRMKVEIWSSQRVTEAIDNAVRWLWILAILFFVLVAAQIVLFFVAPCRYRHRHKDDEEVLYRNV